MLELSQEQEFFLRRLEHVMASMSRQELEEALHDAWEELFHLKQRWRLANHLEGTHCAMEPRYVMAPPETMEEMRIVLGYEPTRQEAQRFLEQLEEARMDVDLEEIAASGLEPPL